MALWASLDRLDLSICDKLGFIRADPHQSRLPFTPLAQHCAGGALIDTSDLEFADWPSVFAGDEWLTAAALDRFAHRCRLLGFRGSSHRFRQSVARRGA